jgi:glucose-1-phosphate adenylyltransferase
MGVYVFNSSALASVLRENAEGNNGLDFGHHIIPALVRKGIVTAFNFTKAMGRFGSYWRDIGTVDAYYRTHMELVLRPFLDPYEQAKWPLCSLHAISQFYSESRRAPAIADSVIAEEASIAHGASVIHSVISPGVQIGECAEVRNSILLPNSQIGDGARVQHAIVDEGASVADGVEIGRESAFNAKHGLVTESGIIVVAGDSHGEPGVAPDLKWDAQSIMKNRFPQRQVGGYRRESYGSKTVS